VLLDLLHEDGRHLKIDDIRERPYIHLSIHAVTSVCYVHLAL
jgi:hypothetical protein